MRAVPGVVSNWDWVSHSVIPALSRNPEGWLGRVPSPACRGSWQRTVFEIVTWLMSRSSA